VGIAKALSTIADMLPRTDLKAIIYPTARMKASIAALYARIMQLLQAAMKWYKKGKINRAVSSITKPWKLEFEQLYQDIIRCSRTVDEVAHAAQQAEMRDMHIKIYELTEVATSKNMRTFKMARLLIEIQNTMLSRPECTTVLSMFKLP